MSALEKAYDKCKKSDFDEIEVVSIKKKIITVRITDSEIAEFKQINDENLGIRLVNKKRISSLHTSITSNIDKDVEFAIKKIEKQKPRDFWQGFPSSGLPNRRDGIFDSKLEELTNEEIIEVTQEIIDLTQNEKITSITGSLHIVIDNFQLKNSSNLEFSEKSSYISAFINAESEMSSVPVSGIGFSNGRNFNSLNISQLAEDAQQMCIENINPQKINFENCSIIFQPYSVGELMAFVISSNFSKKFLDEKKSCFSNFQNQEIAVNNFSLIDDPHIPNSLGTKYVDDEGVPTQKNVLVENGIFKNTFSNLLDAYKGNSKSTGNGIRQGNPLGRSSETNVVSSPHNLQILKGNSTVEDMIKNTKKGLLVNRLWYTYAVNPIKGDFSCTARSGIQIIENGQITNPGKPVRIIHNLPTLFKNISEIGKNQRNVIQWASIPSITPAIKVENMKIKPI